MIKKPVRHVVRKNESVEDPHELLLSLVDLGSLDADEALLACVSEMSDAECKRVLSSLSLPTGMGEVEEPEDSTDDLVALDDEIVAEPEADLPEDDSEAEDGEQSDVDDEAELESRIRKLERSLLRRKSEKALRKFRRMK